MKKWQRYFAISCIILFTGIKAGAKDDEAGLRAYLNYGLHSASFKHLPGIPNCCPRFETASGTTYEASVYYHIPYDSSFYYGLSLGYKWLGGDFSANETTTLNIDENLITGNFRHELRIDLHGISLGAEFGYKLFDKLNFNLGLWGAYYFSNSYNQREVITQPSDEGTFLDSLGNDTGKRTRNEFSGNLPLDISFQVGITGLISYELPLNKTNKYSLDPFIAFELPINELSTDLAWRYNSYKLGLSFNFKLQNENPHSDQMKLEEQALKPDSESITKNDNELNLKYDGFQHSLWKDTIFNLVKLPKDDKSDDEYHKGAVVFDFDTIETYRKTVIREYRTRTDTIELGSANSGYLKLTLTDHKSGKKIEQKLGAYENISVNAVPILNYIFFSKGQYNISYIPEPESSPYGRRGLEFYYTGLDTIGKRLKKFGGGLTLSAPFSHSTDLDSLSASKRIESIENYLITKYGINSERITKLIYPLLTNNDETISGNKLDELMRVEISPENENILQPIYFSDNILSLNPDDIDMNFSGRNMSNTKHWSVSILQNGKLLKKIDETGLFPDKYEWLSGDDYEFVLRRFDPLTFIAETADQNGKILRDTVSLILKDNYKNLVNNPNTGLPKSPRKDYYNILIFDLNSADISDFNKKIISELEHNIKPGCKVKIIGFTDNTGNPDYNRKLSLRRAQNTADLINYPNVEVVGYGNSSAFDNSTPQGRFMNRSVVIMVTFP